MFATKFGIFDHIEDIPGTPTSRLSRTASHADQDGRRSRVRRLPPDHPAQIVQRIGALHDDGIVDYICFMFPTGDVTFEESRRTLESAEDRLGEQRADDVLAGVDDLGDLEVDGEATEEIGVLAAEVVRRLDVVDHRPHGILRGDIEVAADAGGAVERCGVDATGQRRGVPKNGSSGIAMSSRMNATSARERSKIRR